MSPSTRVYDAPPESYLKICYPLQNLLSSTVALPGRDVPLAKNPSTGTAQQRLFLVLKVVLHAVVVISEVLRLSTKSRCSRCCRHISTLDSPLNLPNYQVHTCLPLHNCLSLYRHPLQTPSQLLTRIHIPNLYIVSNQLMPSYV